MTLQTIGMQGIIKAKPHALSLRCGLYAGFVDLMHDNDDETLAAIHQVPQVFLTEQEALQAAKNLAADLLRGSDN